MLFSSPQAGREGKVPFKTIGDVDFRNKWPCMVRKVAWKKLRATVAGNADMKLQDIVTLLIEEITDNPDYAAFFKSEGSEEDTKKALRKKPRKAKPRKPPVSDAFVLDEDEKDEDLGLGLLYAEDYDDHDIGRGDIQQTPSLSIPESPSLRPTEKHSRKRRDVGA